jgi:hypothetical protein
VTARPATGEGRSHDAGAAAEESVKEMATVAVHYVGDGSSYLPGIPTDPTNTTFVTPSQWAQMKTMKGNDGFPLFAIGPAPTRIDDAHPKLARVEVGLANLLERAADIQRDLQLLEGHGLEDMHRSYWKGRVVDTDRELYEFVSASMPSVPEPANAPTNPDQLRGFNDWRDAYVAYLRNRSTYYRSLSKPTLADIGFPPRRTDPGWSGTYMNHLGKNVEIHADNDGIVQPVNEIENGFLDSMGLPRVEET